jgi:hypothetical protein
MPGIPSHQSFFMLHDWFDFAYASFVDSFLHSAFWTKNFPNSLLKLYEFFQRNRTTWIAVKSEHVLYHVIDLLRGLLAKYIVDDLFNFWCCNFLVGSYECNDN